MNKGFTLAELLGVIVILGIVGLMAFTGIEGNIKKSRSISCSAQTKNIIESAKMLSIDYPEILPGKSETTTYSVKVLKEGGTINEITVGGGYIEDDLENPATGKSYTSGTGKIKITSTTGRDFNYEIVFDNENEKCKE